MATKAKPVTAWAVYSPSGYIIFYSINPEENNSKQMACNRLCAAWDALELHGYTCRKIQITEAEK
jgi:hypothetical protein